MHFKIMFILLKLLTICFKTKKMNQENKIKCNISSKLWAGILISLKFT